MHQPPAHTPLSPRLQCVSCKVPAYQTSFANAQANLRPSSALDHSRFMPRALCPQTQVSYPQAFVILSYAKSFLTVVFIRLHCFIYFVFLYTFASHRRQMSDYIWNMFMMNQFKNMFSMHLSPELICVNHSAQIISLPLALESFFKNVVGSKYKFKIFLKTYQWILLFMLVG